ncbi:MAG: tRNA threonylcarbamoyladenosine biosynthesis protein [Clostridiaceae bacterium BRH_c20a]|nr:MAG: tRNA threonylcarbamoyladenosine biosynthesis protein [Clostridiaceae bacterium BRH_c20a]
METRIWKMPGDKPNLAMLKEAAQLLNQGEIIGFPTETVYGLGANALNEEAVKKIYKAKGRPDDNPLIVHICKIEHAKELVKEITPSALKLMENFWPGPLTLVLPKSELVPDIITAGLDTVAIRLPAHPVALKLIELAQVPVAAPSANISGKPSPTTAEHVWQDLKGKIAGIVDGGKAGVGVESTVLDMTGQIPIILRPGGTTREQLMEVIGEVRLDASLHDSQAAPRSPGMKYTHYSPEAEVIILKGTSHEQAGKIKKIIKENRAARVGFMISQELAAVLPKNLSQNIVLEILGRQGDLETITANLFDALRKFDQKNISVIYAESFPEINIGAALMNRLLKAAGGKKV